MRSRSFTRRATRATEPRSYARFAGGAAVVGLALSCGMGCGGHSVSSSSSELSTIAFVAPLHAVTADKVDLLFMIDNSASMGDKQAYLQSAVPELVERLVTPNCIDPTSGNVVGVSTAAGECPNGSHTEFPPVHDLHIGVISSSLGGRGGDVCPTTGANSTPFEVPFLGLSDHNDDQAHLLHRSLTIVTDSNGNPTSATEGTVADAANGFLAWFPNVPANAGATPPASPVTDPAQLSADFGQIVTGVGFFGCGIESQLESWYRFLVQPDPYASIQISNNGDLSTGTATWQGIDTTILQQRHDFLRPDSVVAIVDLTDENDSEIDVRGFSGTSWKFMSSGFEISKASSACATDPNSSSCGSCGFCGGANPPAYCNDPNCVNMPDVYTDDNDWGYNLNLRHVHMKQKYGVDAQYPIQRYVTGLTSAKVPDRTGEYPTGATRYVGTNDCSNPLFSTGLPDGTDSATICNLPQGPRTPNMVSFMIIGGVPADLLHYDPSNPAASQLTSADWTKILGADPLSDNYAGIDPRMIESETPRAGVPTDWTTNQGAAHVLPVDLEYACTFPLTTPRDCSNPANTVLCDCPNVATGLTPDEIPPICDPTNPTMQIAGKAYPAIRELLLAKLLGPQGIAASICPLHTEDESDGGVSDPLYGQRPAISEVVNQLKDSLVQPCLPAALPDDGASCAVFVTLPTVGATCEASYGLSTPDASALSSFRAKQEAAWQAAGGASSGYPDPNRLTVCELNRIPDSALTNGTCRQDTAPGWCYVTGAAAGANCAQSVVFSPTAPPNGATVAVVCAPAATTATDGG